MRITGTVEKLDSSAEADFDIRWTLDSSNRCGIKIYLNSISLELIENATWDNHREISIDFSSFRYLPKLEINIVLKNNNYLSIFYHYCLSLIAKTKGLESSSDIFNAILSTINEWSEFFKKANASKLSPNEQKGLIGELSLLSHFIDKAGINSALGSWRTN